MPGSAISTVLCGTGRSTTTVRGLVGGVHSGGSGGGTPTAQAAEGTVELAGELGLVDVADRRHDQPAARQQRRGAALEDLPASASSGPRACPRDRRHRDGPRTASSSSCGRRPTAGRWSAWLRPAMVWARRCSTMSASKRGWVSASRSSSKPSSRLADSTRSEPLSRSSEAPKPSETAASSWRCRKAWAFERAGAVGQQRRHEAGHARLAVGIRRGAAGEREGQRHDRRALVLDQPGLDAERRRDFLDVDRLRARPTATSASTAASDQRQAQRRDRGVIGCPPPASAARSPRRRRARHAAPRPRTSAGVTAAMRCGQASMSAMVPPVLRHGAVEARPARQRILGIDRGGQELVLRPLDLVRA